MRSDILVLIIIIVASVVGAWTSAKTMVYQETIDVSPTELATVTDATGHVVPAGNYQRIVCGSTIAANVVPRLINSNRVVMVPQWFRDNHNDSFKLDHAPIINANHGVESIIAINPDLVIVNSIDHKQERLTRLRETGITVLDLGSMLGWDTLRNDIRNIGIVLQEQERAEQLLLQIKRRLEHTAIHVPAEERKTAMWLAVYGGKLAGGTVGSSHHHLLRFAGLRDIVAGTVDFGWPSYSVEEVLAYDPDYIVTGGGMSGSSMADDIRAMPGLSQLRAVRENNIITMPKGTDDTGPGLVEAVEFLCDAVYGPPPAIERALLPEEEKK